jgi:hypothetical protein
MGRWDRHLLASQIGACYLGKVHASVGVSSRGGEPAVLTFKEQVNHLKQATDDALDSKAAQLWQATTETKNIERMAA